MKLFKLLKSKGFSLIELGIVLIVISILSTAFVPIVINQAHTKAGEKTALEMSIIQEAARSFYVDNDTWPPGTEILKTQGYLNPQWITNNPWNNAYSLSSNPSTFTVSTRVPLKWVNLVASSLPSTVIDGENISSTISIPGAAFSGLNSGLIVLSENECPAGYTRVSSLDGKFLVGGASFNPSAGGSNTHDHGGYTEYHTLSIAEMPSHNHEVYLHHGGGGGQLVPHHECCEAGSIASVQSSSYTGSSQGHRHATAPADNRPEYATIVLCRKD